jgi:hypothetical protein
MEIYVNGKLANSGEAVFPGCMLNVLMISFQ